MSTAKEPRHRPTTGRRRARVNPLAAARPRAGTVDARWHVKVGAGYRLFVEYYRAQPDGVVVAAGANGVDGALAAPSAGKRVLATAAGAAPSVAAGRGLSRAAKRRRKRKSGGGAITADELALNGSAVGVAAPVAASASPNKRVVNRRLLEELELVGMHAVSSSFREFVKALTRPLPVTFRLRSHLSQEKREAVLRRLEINMKDDREPTPIRSSSPLAADCLLTMPPPEHLAYLSSSSSEATILSVVDAGWLKQPSSAPLAALLQDLTADGSLARQEVGSLLPVLVARAHVRQVQQQEPPQSHRIRRVVDLCSAPGSKTLQLLEWMLEEGCPQLTISSAELEPSKRVRIVANDVNPQRLEELRQAVQRSGVLAHLRSDGAAPVSLRYSNQDASRYVDSKGKHILYDIVLADVPCSGDGTVRKDARVLPYWTPRTAVELHGLQVRILTRALRLLAPGGITVYSTCSLNPVENEAVVAAALQQIRRPSKQTTDESTKSSKDCAEFELLDVSALDLFPLQEIRCGVSTWKVADYTAMESITEKSADEGEDYDEQERLTWYDTYEQAMEAGMEKANPCMWPPGRDDARQVDLTKCLRLWPQDHNTGGFFVALIQRKR